MLAEDQRWPTKLVKQTKLVYNEQLKELGLFSLEEIEG